MSKKSDHSLKCKKKTEIKKKHLELHQKSEKHVLKDITFFFFKKRTAG